MLTDDVGHEVHHVLREPRRERRRHRSVEAGKVVSLVSNISEAQTSKIVNTDINTEFYSALGGLQPRSRSRTRERGNTILGFFNSDINNLGMTLENDSIQVVSN